MPTIPIFLLSFDPEDGGGGGALPAADVLKAYLLHADRTPLVEPNPSLSNILVNSGVWPPVSCWEV